MGISSIIIIIIMLFITLALVAAAVSAQGPLNDQAWQDYKLEYNKHYNADQELTKYAIWRKEVDNVNTHNAAFGNGFKTEINEFSDLTDAEFEETYLSGLRVPEGPSNATMYVPTNDPIPNAVDWRTAGMVTPIKNQGQCGSCYSFSATGALEGAWKKAKGSLPSLSEQEIVDCSGRYGNYGCQGGWYQSSWRYLRDAGGDESKLNNKRQNELIPYNDCLYKNMYRYEYIALLDIDEVIVPIKHKNWEDMMEEVIKTSLKVKNESRASWNF